MDVEVVARYATTLPPDDDHPYRTGAWAPNHDELDARELHVIGDLPTDLNGVYLRNTENPLLDSLGTYHPFDGDGMIHQMAFRDGAVEYRNRFVRTDGLLAEIEASRPLWSGISESPRKSEREGWGARTRMKDAASTDVVVHNGRALCSFYQCGEGYELDPWSLDSLGKAPWVPDWGVSAHQKVDDATGELLFFNYAKEPPFMNYGVVDASGQLVHYVPIELPGPRLPHDMTFTENHAILNDCPLFWDQQLLQRDVHAVRFHPDLPMRLGVLPRRGAPDEVRWFDCDPTFVLHWINAWEEGDEIVVDGFHQEFPEPPARAEDGYWDRMFRFLDNARVRPRPYRWRLNLRTGQVTEGPLDDQILEFGMINRAHGGRPYRYTYAMTTKPGWFLFDGLVRLDVVTGQKQEYRFPEGTFASESPIAAREGSQGEDDGYVTTFTTDMVNDVSECQIFDAADISQGPVARVVLPRRITSGTHSCWAPAGLLPPRS